MSGIVRKFAEIFVQMRTLMKQIKTICLLLAVLTALTACVSSDDDNTTTTLYGDAAITAFTLGTVNRYDSDGTLSTYTGSTYTFKIDQLKRTIENALEMGSGVEDSYWLPVGTDLGHIICSITTKNNGSLQIKSVDDDTFVSYAASDSIDFTKDNTRVFRVTASDGSGYTDYTVRLNVHTADGDTFVWEKVSQELPASPALPAGIKHLIGKSTKEQYALSEDDQLMVSRDEGASWTTDVSTSHEGYANLPKENLTLVSYAFGMADKTDYVLLAGTGSDAQHAQIWRKIVDYSGDTPTGTWTYIERNSNEPYFLPAMQSLNIIRYDGVLLATGGDYQTFSESRDNGLTWQQSKRLSRPDDFDYQATSIKMEVDTDNYIWMYCYGTNEVWRGRLNRLGWK